MRSLRKTPYSDTTNVSRNTSSDGVKVSREADNIASVFCGFRAMYTVPAVIRVPHIVSSRRDILNDCWPVAKYHKI